MFIYLFNGTALDIMNPRHEVKIIVCKETIEMLLPSAVPISRTQEMPSSSDSSTDDDCEND